MDIKEYNATSLAYMGDAIMSVYVRKMLLNKGYQKSKVLQKLSEDWVSAKAQYRFVRQLKNDEFFSEEEWQIVLRGRNTHTKSKAKNAEVMEYRWATGLESLFGWLYLNEQYDRLEALWNAIIQIGE